MHRYQCTGLLSPWMLALACKKNRTRAERGLCTFQNYKHKYATPRAKLFGVSLFRRNHCRYNNCIPEHFSLQHSRTCHFTTHNFTTTHSQSNCFRPSYFFRCFSWWYLNSLISGHVIYSYLQNVNRSSYCYWMLVLQLFWKIMNGNFLIKVLLIFSSFWSWYLIKHTLIFWYFLYQVETLTK